MEVLLESDIVPLQETVLLFPLSIMVELFEDAVHGGASIDVEFALQAIKVMSYQALT